MADAWDPRYGPHPRAQYTGKTTDPSRPGGLPGRDGPRHGKFDPATGPPAYPPPLNLATMASRFQQYVVPFFFPDVPAPPIATSTSKTFRVHVRNIGPVLVFLSDVLNDINNTEGPTGAVVRLPANDRDVFVLAPNQTLYALAAGPGGLLSVAISQALASD